MNGSGAVEPGPVPRLKGQWEGAAGPEQQVRRLLVVLVVAGAEQAFPVREALRALAAWACRPEEMLSGPGAAVALAPLVQIGAPVLGAVVAAEVALSQRGQSVQTRLLMLPGLVAR